MSELPPLALPLPKVRAQSPCQAALLSSVPRNAPVTGGHIKKNIGARRLQGDHLGIHGRVGGFIGSLRHDARVALVAEPIFQSFHVVLTVIVVLIKYGDLAAIVMFEDI